jgi:hypothetical protein
MLLSHAQELDHGAAEAYIVIESGKDQHTETDVEEPKEDMLEAVLHGPGS